MFNFILQSAKDLKCNSCESDLGLENFVVLDKNVLLNEIINSAIDVLNSEIGECTYCNCDIIQYTQNPQSSEDPLDLKTGYDLMAMYNIPEELYSDIASGLKCKCGTTINLDDPYVTKEEVEAWYSDEETKKITEVIVKTFGITQDDALDFSEHLLKYPMLGLEHEVGKIIYDKILNKDVQGIVFLSCGQIMYRARKRNAINRLVPYVENELWAPPVGMPGHGRYNPAGVQVLYLGDSVQTCLDEIKLDAKDQDEVAELAEFLLLKNVEVWDVTGLDINELLSIPTMNNRTISREYLLPNFLAQCCTKAKINGIKYGSTKGNGRWNIAMLNYKDALAIYNIKKEIRRP